MSDLASSQDDGTFEPDEETLMSALRNQDDIPILMDIVNDTESFTSRQEAHLRHSFDDPLPDEPIESGAPFDLKSHALSQAISPQKTHSQQVQNLEAELSRVNKAVVPKQRRPISQERITHAINLALQKRLPAFVAEVVADVMQDLQTPTKPVKPIATKNTAYGADAHRQTP